MMNTKTLAKKLLAISLFGVVGCANTESAEESYRADRIRPATAQQAAELLGCEHDEVAVCIQTNCDLDDFYCADSNDVKKMFRAGDFRYE